MFFIHFVVFTSDHVVVVVVVVYALCSEGPLYIVRWLGSNPWWELIGIPFSIVG